MCHRMPGTPGAAWSQFSPSTPSGQSRNFVHSLSIRARSRFDARARLVSSSSGRRSTGTNVERPVFWRHFHRRRA